MTRRTVKPVTRAEAKRILAAPVRDVEHARLAASYLDLLDAIGKGHPGDVVDLFMAAKFGEPDGLIATLAAAPEDDPE